MMLNKVSRVWNTVRFMTPRQWKYRLYYTARNKIRKRVPKQAGQSLVPILLPTFYAPNIGNTDTTVADGILKNEIPTVSGRTVLFSGDWDLTGEDYRLVCFRLNSFRWLLELSDAYKATGNRAYIDKGLALIRNWQESCGHRIGGDKWNAYVIAERITNWIGFCSEYAPDDIVEYARMIEPQAQELKDSLEYQLGANHLLSEAKALVYAGAFLQDGDLYKTGKELLIAEAKEQFLQDGGHYEQSVSYHVEALQQYFEAYALMRIVNDPDSDKFADLMRKPYCFLNDIIGVNGKIPLFNDAAYDYPFYDAADFLATASYIYESEPPKGRKGCYYSRWSWLGTGSREITWTGRTINEGTGLVHYQFDQNKKQYSFYMDCGNNGPDYNLGHTHADALSVLLCSEDKEILVDSGVFTYQPGSERNACRSTAAHNTVEVDGQSSAEVWSAFRVAKRGHTYISDLTYGDELRVTASHDGYEKILLSPVRHTRKVEVRDGKITIRDSLHSKSEHNAISRYHIGSNCEVEQTGARTCRIDGHIIVNSDSDMIIRDCIIATRFGMPEKAKCLEIAFQGAIQTTFEIK